MTTNAHAMAEHPPMAGGESSSLSAQSRRRSYGFADPADPVHPADAARIAARAAQAWLRSLGHDISA